MIFVTGDTHRHWMERLSTEAFPEQTEMTKEDYVIICGDFGIWDGGKWEEQQLNWLENRNFTTIFVSGNHDNYDMLDALPVAEWHGGKVNFIRPSVIHLMRGQIFELEKKLFFTFGGASSHDIQDGILELEDPDFKRKTEELDKRGAWYRINHRTWWERELPSKEEMWEGLKNLARVDNKVDYIITHCPDNMAQQCMSEGILCYEEDRLTGYLEYVRNITEFSHWFYGHMHYNCTYQEINSTCLYEQIIRIM